MNPYTIGAVLEQLRGEFTDLTISKIRYLEDQGLVQPQRTPSGYRKYGDRDVARLRWALRVQRDRYLPLKVIREELERLGDAVIQEVADPQQAPAPPAAPPPVVDDGVAAAELRATPPVATAPTAGTAPATPGEGTGTPTAAAESVTLRELADHLDVDADLLRGLRDNGLLPDREPYGPHDVRVARWCVKLLGAGLEARHLRMYPQFADRETSLVEQLLVPLQRQRNPQARARAEELATEVAEAGARLHAALLSRALHDLLHNG